MKFYQACYGKDDTGWGIFNVSKDIPPDALTFFEKVGSNCNPHMVNNSICEEYIIFKIVSNEDYCCTYKSKYDGKDRFGRSKMFTHGFIIPSSDYKSNPNIVISIADSNYKYSIADSSVVPTTLKTELYTETFNVNNNLLKCVYILLASKYDFPLYIVCNQSEKTIKTIIEFILNSLPFSLRTDITFTNSDVAVSTSEKTIVFSENIPDNKCYYSLINSETNINDKLEKFGSDNILYPLYRRSTETDKDIFFTYCVSLEEKLKMLNKSNKYTIDDISTADKLNYSKNEIEQIDDKLLLIYASKLLSNVPLKSEPADEILSMFLTVCEKRKLNMPLPILKKAVVRLGSTKSTKYRECLKGICEYLFGLNSNEYVINYLLWQYGRSHSTFEKWKNYFYSINIEIDYSELCMMITREYVRVDDYQDIYRYFDLNGLCQNSKWDFLKHFIDVVNDSLNEEPFEEYKKIYELINDITNAFTNYKKAIYSRISHNYWKSFSIERFEFNKECIDALKLIQPIDVCMSKLINIYEEKDQFNRLKTANSFIKTIKASCLPHKIVCEKLFDYIYVNATDEIKKSNFQFWYDLSSQIDNENPLSVIIKYHIPVLCSTELFKDDLLNINTEISKIDKELSHEIDVCQDETLSIVLIQNKKVLKQRIIGKKFKSILRFDEKEGN